MSSVGRLPASALPMAGGLLMVGIGGFGFLAVVGHTTSASSAAALSALYLIGNVCGPGLFAGLEQEASRVVSSGLAAGVDIRPGLRRVVAAGIGLTGAALLVLVALAPVLVPRSFAGHAGLLLWLLLGVTGSAQAFLVRGILGGAGRFGAYGVTLAVEGAARLLPCLAFAALGVTDVNVYGLVFAGAMGFAAAASSPSLRRGALSLAPRASAARAAGAERTAPPAGRASVAPADAGVGAVVLDDDRVAAASAAGAAGSPVAVEVREAVEAGQALRSIVRGVGLLGVATLLAQLVANLAPLVVTGRMLGSASGEAAAAAFAFAFVLTRAPLLLFSPVQALLLPRVAAAVVRGDLDLVRRQVRTGLVAVAVVGAGGAAVATLAGPWAVQTLFGAEQRPSVLVTGLLGVSTGLLLVVQLLQPVLVALGRHRTVSVAWIVGTAVLAGLLVLPGPAVTAAVIAQLTAAAVVALVALSGVVDVLRAAPVAGDRAAARSSLVSTECVRSATERALEPR
jgi:O-antigen/teichoic acid export membrane protein